MQFENEMLKCLEREEEAGRLRKTSLSPALPSSKNICGREFTSVSEIHPDKFLAFHKLSKHVQETYSRAADRWDDLTNEPAFERLTDQQKLELFKIPQNEGTSDAYLTELLSAASSWEDLFELISNWYDMHKLPEMSDEVKDGVFQVCNTEAEVQCISQHVTDVCTSF